MPEVLDLGRKLAIRHRLCLPSREYAPTNRLSQSHKACPVRELAILRGVVYQVLQLDVLLLVLLAFFHNHANYDRVGVSCDEQF